MENVIEDPLTPILNAIKRARWEGLDASINLPMIKRNTNNLNEIDNQYGTTPLHHAVLWDPLLVQHLLKHGAYPSLKNKNGCTPLHNVANCKSRRIGLEEEAIYDICKLLLEHGANCNELNIECSAVHCALRSQSLKTIKLLLDNGGDMEAVSKKGRTSMHFAAENPDINVIAFILDQGFQIECIDHDGCSPLHFAARQANFKACEFLLARGAIVNKECKVGKTPLQIVYSVRRIRQKTELEKTVEILLKFGADGNDKIQDIYEHSIQ